MAKKRDGVNAAAWFYAQPGFHAAPTEPDVEATCIHGKPVRAFCHPCEGGEPETLCGGDGEHCYHYRPDPVCCNCGASR